MAVTVIIAQTPMEREWAFAIRRQVFVIEQKVPETRESDEYDERSLHFVALEDGQPVGACRMRWVNPNVAKAERVAVLPSKRHSGAGRLLMEALETQARQEHAHAIVLHAQMPVIPFYEKLGYHVMGEPFVDAGIPHVSMKKKLI
jgi:predicted GNAT family N-acyltransferase